MVPGVLVATAAALFFGRFFGRPPLRDWYGPMDNRTPQRMMAG
jgi:sodium/proline symporter